MKSGRCLIQIIFLLFTLPYIYGGCVVVFSSGDINRNKNLSHTDTTVGFIGITSQAEFNTINAKNLTSSAFTGGSTNVEPLNRSFFSPRTAAFRPLKFPRVLLDSLRSIESVPKIITFSSTDVTIQNGNFQGGCGGSFSYALEFNSMSEGFNGNILFEDYCDDGILVSGQTDVDGYFDIATGNFKTANFLFDNLRDDYLTFEGEISIDFSAIPILIIFTAYCTDAHTGKVYWIEEYNMSLAERFGHIEVELFGTFYHPDHGFVVLITSDPFIVHDGDDWPISGQMIILGAKATKAQLTALDQLHLGIEADTDGDGLLNWDSGLLSWSDI